MLFSSSLFLFLFLPIVLLGNVVIERHLRNAWLLLVSLVFYGWGEPFVVSVMLLSILANWAIGLWMQSARTARGPLIAAVGFNVGLLVFFKYTDFLTGTASDFLLALGLRDHPLPLLGQVWPRDSILYGVLFEPRGGMRLPIGISFFTFQAMSYLIDIRRGEVAAMRSPLDMGTYKALFPQLIAGPIVRYRDIEDQIATRQITVSGFALGIRRFVIGLGKKMLIANTVAAVADDLFAVPTAALPPACAWLGIVCYTVQIYFDFSGYSDMAIGLGHMLGFRFRENFDHPYVARSITDFWRRWHISLSTWFRDYLYIPMGGNRRGPLRTYFNLLLVFTLCGFWHGASWTFLVWGLWHGMFLVIERLGLGAWLERRPAVVRHAYLLLTVMIGWVFFRAETLGKAVEYLGAMVGASHGDGERYHVDLYTTSPVLTALAAAVIGATPLVVRACARAVAIADARHVAIAVATRLLGLAALAAVFGVSCMRMAAGTYNPFLYFRF